MTDAKRLTKAQRISQRIEVAVDELEDLITSNMSESSPVRVDVLKRVARVRRALADQPDEGDGSGS